MTLSEKSPILGLRGSSEWYVKLALEHSFVRIISMSNEDNTLLHEHSHSLSKSTPLVKYYTSSRYVNVNKIDEYKVNK
jgi:hypothetical protein